MESLSLKLINIIKKMQDDLIPGVLGNWYFIVQSKARELCQDDELKEKIIFEQDPILPMKFRLSISKRTVHFVINAIEELKAEMPYSTRLYFEKVQEIILQEFAKTTIDSR